MGINLNQLTCWAHYCVLLCPPQCVVVIGCMQIIALLYGTTGPLGARTQTTRQQRQYVMLSLCCLSMCELCLEESLFDTKQLSLVLVDILNIKQCGAMDHFILATKEYLVVCSIDFFYSTDPFLCLQTEVSGVFTTFVINWAMVYSSCSKVDFGFNLSLSLSLSLFLTLLF